MKLTIRTNPEIVIEIENDKTRPVLPIATAPEPVADKEKFCGILDKAINTPPKKTAKGKRHCKKCGEAGHRSDHCPQDGEGTDTIKEKILNFASS